MQKLPIPEEALALLPEGWEILTQKDIQVLGAKHGLDFAKSKMARWRMLIQIPKEALTEAVNAAEDRYAEQQGYVLPSSSRKEKKAKAPRAPSDAAVAAGKVKNPFPYVAKCKCARLFEELTLKTDESDRVFHKDFWKLPNKNQAPEYYEKVKNPLDIQVIANNLKRTKGSPYFLLEDFLADAETMFRNAEAFHGEGAPIFADAQFLRQRFREKVRAQFRRADFAAADALVADPEKGQAWREAQLAPWVESERLRLEKKKEREQLKANHAGGGAALGEPIRAGMSQFHNPKDRERRLNLCLKVIHRVMKLPVAWPFNEPVNAEALGIPEYRQIIKKPMDLGTIAKKLEVGKSEKGWESVAYRGPEQVLKDVELVWANCKKFNVNPGDEIREMCAQTEAKTKELWDKEIASLPTDAQQLGANVVGEEVGAKWGQEYFYGKVAAYAPTLDLHLVEYDSGLSVWGRLDPKSTVFASDVFTRTANNRKKSQRRKSVLPPEGEACVGLTVSIWWRSCASLFHGQVMEFDPQTGKHKVQYEDGDVKWLDLAKDWVIYPPPEAAPEVAAEPADPEGAAAVGWKVGVWWEADACFYYGVVQAFDAAAGAHEVLYDDGVTEQVRFEDQDMEFVGPAAGKGKGKGKGKKRAQAAPPAGAGAVGWQVGVWWDDDGRFYNGRVAAYDAAKGLHEVYYDDGTVEYVDLGKEKVEYIAKGGDPAKKKLKVKLKIKKPEPPKGAAAVGWRVGIWWDDDGCFYHGRVTSHDGRKGLHEVSYDDGTVEWVNLGKEKVEFDIKEA